MKNKEEDMIRMMRTMKGRHADYEDYEKDRNYRTGKETKGEKVDNFCFSRKLLRKCTGLRQSGERG
jgi:hypothetical protein